jgi:thioredoxin 1
MRPWGLGRWDVVLACFAVVSTLAAGPTERVSQKTKPAQPPSATAKNAAHDSPVAPIHFQSLDQWKAAVLAGDKSSLAALYSINPASMTESPEGKSVDSNVEPDFWARLKAAGLTGLDVKVLEFVQARPGIQAVNMRIEFDLTAASQSQHFVVSLLQYWIDTAGAWRVVASKRGTMAAQVIHPRLPQPKVTNPNLYPPAEEAQAELTAALAAAGRDHKRVIVVFGGNWCYDCHVLDATFHSRQIAPLVRQYYEVVHINIGEYDQNLDIAQRYQIPLNKGVPSLAVLESDGKLVVRSGDFENSLKVGPEDVSSFLNKWKPARTKQGT